jgi:hypothetical protein
MKDQIGYQDGSNELKPSSIVELLDDLSDIDITYLDIELL